MKRESKKRQLVKDASGNVKTQSVKGITMAVYRTIVNVTRKDEQGRVVHDKDGSPVRDTYTGDEYCPDVETLGDAGKALDAAIKVFGIEQVFDDFFYGHDLYRRRIVRPQIAGVGLGQDDELYVMGWIGGSRDKAAREVKGQWRAAKGKDKKKVLLKALADHIDLIEEFHQRDNDEDDEE